YKYKYKIDSVYCIHRHTPRSTLFPYTTLFRSVGISKPGQMNSLGDCEVNVAGPARRDLLLVTNVSSINSGVRIVLVKYLHRGKRSEEHTSELQSHLNLVCRLLLDKKK